jgi:hypothetical protein
MSAVMSEPVRISGRAEGRSLAEEREFLRACVRAEIEAALRGQGSIQIVDQLCQRLDAVEASLRGPGT